MYVHVYLYSTCHTPISNVDDENSIPTECQTIVFLNTLSQWRMNRAYTKDNS